MIQSSQFERALPWLLAALGAGLALTGLARGYIPCAADLSELFAAAINVAGIAIGFLATMKAILLGIKHSRAVRILRRTNRWTGVLRKIRKAIVWSFLSAMLSAILLILDPAIFKNSVALNYIAIGLWGGIIGGAIGSSYLVIDILFAIVEADDAAAEPSAGEGNG